VAYWYFTFVDKQKQNVSSFLRSLIVQLYGQRRGTPKALRDSYRLSVEGTLSPSINDLQVMLSAVIDGFEDVYIFIDALDECPRLDGSRERMMDKLHAIFRWKKKSLHVLTTSRKEHDIEKVLTLAGQSLPVYNSVKLEEKYVQEDVQLFVRNALRNRSFNKWNPELKQEVEEVLTSRAQGMYEYSFLSGFQLT
jgi:ankyrin repeat domain-containing protein 50